VSYLRAGIPYSTLPLSGVNLADALPTFRRFELGTSGFGSTATALLPIVCQLPPEARRPATSSSTRRSRAGIWVTSLGSESVKRPSPFHDLVRSRSRSTHPIRFADVKRSLLSTILPTFYYQLFCSKVFWEAFLYLQFGVAIFFVEKADRKMGKLKPLVNFTNILQYSFAQKIIKSNLNYRKASKNTFVWKSCF